MKLFISQGMRGKTDEAILVERNKAIEIVREMFPDDEIEVLDSFFRMKKNQLMLRQVACGGLVNHLNFSQKPMLLILQRGGRLTEAAA